MPTGHVKFYKAEKGFGFITPDNVGPDLFVHIYRCPNYIEALQQGQPVTYDEHPSRKKPGTLEAVNVRPAEGTVLPRPQIR
jgi:CspA family cold shock protein